MEKLVFLKPNNKRLKQLIREHGREWVVTETSERVQCFNFTPGCLVETIDGKHSRWVKPTDIEPPYVEIVRGVWGDNNAD